MSNIPLVVGSFLSDELQGARGPEFTFAMRELGAAGQIESLRSENLLPGAGVESRDQNIHFSGANIRIAAYDLDSELGVGGSIPVTMSSVPLSSHTAYMASSRITDGGATIARFDRSLRQALEDNYAGVYMGYGVNPYGDFVVYSRYVYPESRTLPLVRPFMVDSEDGVSIGYTLVGNGAVDPIGVVFLFKQLRRCHGCGNSPDAYRAGEYRRCKQCVLNGGMCAWYCSSRCHRADWAAHKPACETPRINTRMQKELFLA